MNLHDKQLRVLLALKIGVHLTVLTAITECGTTELRRIVNRLRTKGHNIQSYRKEGQQYKHYFLNEN